MSGDEGVGGREKLRLAAWRGNSAIAARGPLDVLVLLCLDICDFDFICFGLL